MGIVPDHTKPIVAGKEGRDITGQMTGSSSGYGQMVPFFWSGGSREIFLNHQALAHVRDWRGQTQTQENTTKANASKW